MSAATLPRPEVAPAPSAAARRLAGHRITLLVGGRLDKRRREGVAAGVWPRIDVLELESRLGARVLDFGSLAEAGPSRPLPWLLWRLAQRLGSHSAFLACYAAVATRNDEVVYATGEDVGIPLGALLRLARRRRPALVVRIEDPTLGRSAPRHFAYHSALRFAAKRMHRVLCRTRASAQYVNSVMRVPPSKATFLAETTDSRYFSADAVSEQPGDAGLDLPPQPYVFSAGAEMRDYATLIEAVRDLDVQVLIASGSRWSAGSSRGGDGDLPPNVRVSSFTPAQMRQLYHHAAFVAMPVLPTLRACGMNAVLEAWALGKAVVATRTPGLADYAREGTDTLFVEPGDVAGWRRTIERLLANPDEAEQLGRAGRERVEAELDLDCYLATIESELESALADPAEQA